MPTISNMCRKLDSKISKIPFIILVWDIENLTFWQLNRPDIRPTKETSFTIVLDPKYNSSSVLYPDTYYCNTLEELAEIINFVSDSYPLYLENILNHEYDNLITRDSIFTEVKYNTELE